MLLALKRQPHMPPGSRVTSCWERYTAAHYVLNMFHLIFILSRKWRSSFLSLGFILGKEPGLEEQVYLSTF